MARKKCACRAYPDAHHCFQWAEAYRDLCGFCSADHPLKAIQGGPTVTGRRMGEFEFAAAQEEAEDQMFKLEETEYSGSGVMRCCIQSLGNYFDTNDGDIAIGTKVECETAKDAADHGMTLIDRGGKGMWIASWIAEK